MKDKRILSLKIDPTLWESIENVAKNERRSVSQQAIVMLLRSVENSNSIYS